MEWKNLSDDAKGVIEWVVNPFTNIKEIIEIKIGSVFHRNCPKLCRNLGKSLDNVNITITQKLYQEILKFVTESEDMQYEQSTDGLIFRLKDDIEIR